MTYICTSHPGIWDYCQGTRFRTKFGYRQTLTASIRCGSPALIRSGINETGAAVDGIIQRSAYANAILTLLGEDAAFNVAADSTAMTATRGLLGLLDALVAPNAAELLPSQTLDVDVQNLLGTREGPPDPAGLFSEAVK